MTKTDKLCALLLAGCFLAPNLAVMAMDEAAIRAATATEADKPPAVTVVAPDIDFTSLVEAVEAHRETLYWSEVPLDLECKTALRDACEANGVPICLALGLIEVESGFDPEAYSGVSRGLMQLNERYFPADLSPEDNIRAGVSYLGELLERYDNDTQAALRAYNRGFDDGDRVYARVVLDASEKYGKG